MVRLHRRYSHISLALAVAGGGVVAWIVICGNRERLDIAAITSEDSVQRAEALDALVRHLRETELPDADLMHRIGAVLESASPEILLQSADALRAARAWDWRSFEHDLIMRELAIRAKLPGNESQ